MKSNRRPRLSHAEPRENSASERPLIVAYHAVGSSPASVAVDEHALGEHLALLAGRGYVGLTFAESERGRREGTLPPRSVAITFDDGFASVFRAKPLLDKAGFRATVFVVTSFVDSGEPLAWEGLDPAGEPTSEEEFRPLGWSELAALADSGWEIGSHTVTHSLLSNLDDDALLRELCESRDRIRRRLGDCATVAYPYGLPDRRVAAAAQRAGYLAGCTLTGAHTADGAFLRPRVGLGNDDRGLRLRAKLSQGGLALRRSPLAKAARTMRRRRAWLPQ